MKNDVERASEYDEKMIVTADINQEDYLFLIREPIDNPEDYCVSMVFLSNVGIMRLQFLDRSSLDVLSEYFETPATGLEPDFNDIEIIDCGQALRLGDYQICVDTIRKEHA